MMHMQIQYQKIYSSALFYRSEMVLYLDEHMHLHFKMN